MSGGVGYGSPLSSSNTNQAFLDANGDDVAQGKIGFADSDPVSGATVDNIQREANSESSYTGKPLNSVKDILPAWTNNDVGSSSDNLKERADALTYAFNNVFGHKHDGSVGGGAYIVASDLSSVPYRAYGSRGTDITGVTGASTDVSSLLVSKNPSSSPSTLGVVVNTPYNMIILRQATGASSGDQFVDLFGNVVYGRLTFSTPVWTLSYYVLISGTETAYSFVSASNVAWYFQEIFNPMVSPPTYDSSFFVPSDNATQDVVDASPTQSGKVNTTTQSFGGNKTFVADLTFNQRLVCQTSVNSSLTGTAAALAAPSSYLVALTNASLVSIATVTSGSSDNQIFVILNKTGMSIDLVNNAGANGFITGTAADLTLNDGSSVTVIHMPADSRWYIVGGSGSGGGTTVQGIQEVLGTGNGVTTSFGPLSQSPINAASIEVYRDGLIVPASEWSLSTLNIVFGTAPATAQDLYVSYLYNATPVVPSGNPGALTVYGAYNSGTVVTAAGGVVINATAQRQVQFLKSNGGAVTVTANPQITAGTIIGQELILTGVDNTDYVILNNGTGLALNGAVSLLNQSNIYLFWDGSVWSEISRR